jgi:hypothetical protein
MARKVKEEEVKATTTRKGLFIGIYYQDHHTGKIITVNSQVKNDMEAQAQCREIAVHGFMVKDGPVTRYLLPGRIVDLVVYEGEVVVEEEPNAT